MVSHLVSRGSGFLGENLVKKRPLASIVGLLGLAWGLQLLGDIKIGLQSCPGFQEDLFKTKYTQRDNISLEAATSTRAFLKPF